MTEQEYEGRCGACGTHWYLRFQGITDTHVGVRCPRCGNGAVAIAMPPQSGRGDDGTVEVTVTGEAVENVDAHTKRSKCDYCSGTGVKGPPHMSYDCPDCGGTGVPAERLGQDESTY